LVTNTEIQKFIAHPPFDIKKEEVDIYLFEIEKQLSNSTRYDKLPTQIIHGDLFYGNMLFNQDDVSGILDFEFSTMDLRVMDLAISISHFILWKDPDDPNILNSVACFVQGYSEVTGLTKEEINVIPDLILIRSLSLFHYFYNRYLGGNEDIKRVERHFKVFFTIKKWVDINHEHLISICKKLNI